MRILIMAAALVATPATAATDQFDVICQGGQKLSPNGRVTPREVRYRLDLNQKIWCRDDCSQIKSIQEVNAGQIVFEIHEKTNDSDFTVRHSIDRTTGHWTDFYSSPGVRNRNFYSPGAWFDIVGKCEIANFSGFPTRKF